jgi:hypothetical protein
MDDNEKLVLKSIKNYRAQGYTDEQIKTAMKNSGIADDVAMKLLNHKPFYFHVAFFVPVILALVFAGVLGAYFLGYFNVESIDEVELNEEVVVGETNFVEDVLDTIKENVLGDADEVVCGDGVCDSNEKTCYLDCGCETDAQCATHGSYKCSSLGDCYKSIGISGGGSSSSRSSGGGSSSSSSGGGGSSSGGGSSDGGSGIVVSAPAVEDCDDQIDNDGDNLVDTFGGCDSDVDEIIDYQCGCLDEGLAKIMNYGDSSLTCDYAYGCVNLSTQEIISGTSCGRGEDIEGVWYNFDNDCEIEEIVTKVEICDDGQDNDDDGLVDCDDIDCVSDEACKSCSDDDDCPTGAACDTSTNECVECVDSDGGSNIYKTGSVTGIFEGDFVYQTLTDYCVDSNTVFEYFCYEASGYFDTEGEIDCGEGYSCVEGACELMPAVEICDDDEDCPSDAACDLETSECITCVDTDGGMVTEVFGTTYGVFGIGSGEVIFREDSCVDGGVLEGYCSSIEGNTFLFFSEDPIDCSVGYSCVEGACELMPAVEICDDDEDCVGNFGCDEAVGTCYTSCDYSLDPSTGTDLGCDAGYICSGGVCMLSSEPMGVIVSETFCDNGLDDDGDGLIDCADGDCFEYSKCRADCDNGLDDDCDGLIDYYGTCAYLGTTYLCDVSLESSPGAAGPYKEGCYFDFGDGSVGYCDDYSEAVYSYDSDCESSEDTSEGANVDVSNCDDGIDNDGDGLIDYYGTCAYLGTTYLCDIENPSKAQDAINCYFEYDGALVTCDTTLLNSISGDSGTAVYSYDNYCIDPFGFESPTEICDDLVDNDGDGMIDCLDIDCATDDDCIVCLDASGIPLNAPEVEQSFFQRLLSWLIFWR